MLRIIFILSLIAISLSAFAATTEQCLEKQNNCLNQCLMCDESGKCLVDVASDPMFRQCQRICGNVYTNCLTENKSNYSPLECYPECLEWDGDECIKWSC